MQTNRLLHRVYITFTLAFEATIIYSEERLLYGRFAAGAKMQNTIAVRSSMAASESTVRPGGQWALGIEEVLTTTTLGQTTSTCDIIITSPDRPDLPAIWWLKNNSCYNVCGRQEGLGTRLETIYWACSLHSQTCMALRLVLGVQLLWTLLGLCIHATPRPHSAVW